MRHGGKGRDNIRTNLCCVICLKLQPLFQFVPVHFQCNSQRYPCYPRSMKAVLLNEKRFHWEIPHIHGQRRTLIKWSWGIWCNATQQELRRPAEYLRLKNIVVGKQSERKFGVRILEKNISQHLSQQYGAVGIHHQDSFEILMIFRPVLRSRNKKTININKIILKGLRNNIT